MTTKETAIKLIPDLGSSLIDYVRDKLNDKLKRNLVPLSVWKGASVYAFGDQGNGYVCLVDRGTLIYFVRYKQVKLGGNRFGRQVLVWRDKMNSRSAGFAAYVFFQILLPKFGLLVSDSLQTSAGASFWQYAVNHSLDQGLNVYLYDRSSRPNTLTKIQTKDHFVELSDSVWGTTNAHQLKLLCVSRLNLVIKPSSERKT